MPVSFIKQQMPSRVGGETAAQQLEFDLEKGKNLTHSRSVKLALAAAVPAAIVLSYAISWTVVKGLRPTALTLLAGSVYVLGKMWLYAGQEALHLCRKMKARYILSKIIRMERQIFNSQKPSKVLSEQRKTLTWIGQVTKRPADFTGFLDILDKTPTLHKEQDLKRHFELWKEDVVTLLRYEVDRNPQPAQGHR